MSKVLITGFEPFGGEEINPSLELCKKLVTEDWGDIELEMLQLPVVFGESIKLLKEKIDQCDPDVVLGIGQAGGRTALSIERVAINMDDARIADNAGNKPIDQVIRQESPAAYLSNLPIKMMMQASREVGVPALVSNTAGTYVCNHLMFGIMDLLAGTKKRGGFIHIPFLPEQVTSKPKQPSMSLETMLLGLKAMILAAVRTTEDVAIVGGELD